MPATDSHLHTSWAVNPYSWKAAQTLATALDTPLAVAMVLCSRGLSDPATARDFLDCTVPMPDPFLFAAMEGAVDLITAAMQQQTRIVVHGDYDADGITATALLVIALRDLGAEPEWYLPNRFEEGFGLSRHAVEVIAQGSPGLLITVDCGVNYPAEVALAREHGFEVVVIDHHQPGPVLPECHVIHPAVGTYPHEDLCGVGLALKVMHALHAKQFGEPRDRLPEALTSLLDLVAVGTIADLASLRGENRFYVREGLKLIEIGSRVGLRALVEVAGCRGRVDAGTVAYRLAPRLNAAGRMADPEPPLRLLLADDQREALELAGRLHDLNGYRQDVERKIFEEALEQVESTDGLPPVLVLAAEGWHEGVVGIVASRLVERYNRPTVLLSIRDQVAKGSGRSVPAYDLLSGLVESEHLLTVYGGHTQAVGLTLEADHLEGFRRELERHAAQRLSERDLTPVYRADVILRGEDVNTDTASALVALGPFGSDNPLPRVLLVDACLREAETTRTGAHLRCQVETDRVRTRAIGFGMGSYAALAADGDCGYLVGARFRVDEWRGVERPEFLIERIGLTGSDGACRPETCLGLDPSRPGDRAEPVPGRRGGLAALAQVLATGERTVVFVGDLARTVPDVLARVPVHALSAGNVAYVGRRWQPETPSSPEGTAVFAEWDAADDAVSAAKCFSHAVLLDPPYQTGHTELLRVIQGQGTVIHRLFGPAERAGMAALLRYLLHPRFAMVCLYRALQQCPAVSERATGWEGDDGDALFLRTRALGWTEGGVMLGQREIRRARQILSELGVERSRPGEAKLEPRTSATYVAAETEYEECLRLCRTL